MFRIACAAALLLASSAPAQTSDWTDAATVTITLSNFDYEPETIELEHGRAYRLRFVNAASGGHNFVARDFFAAAEIAERDRATVAEGKVELDGGESVEVRLVAPAAGEYEVHCSHFLHSTFGMTGEIVVR